jgi:diguanylate cyclase (GGDEF)-like protein
MTHTEIIFVAARSAIVLLCLAALLDVLRHPMTPARFGAGQGRTLTFAAALLLAAVLLTVNDIRAALSPGEQMATYTGAWLWLPFDAGVPLLMIQALRLVRQRDAALNALERASVTDALTGLANRRGFDAAATAALQACQRRGEPAAIVMLDLDHFKRINDGFGHAAGDAVLRGVSDALRRHLRASDIAGRLGGEEFAILCPATTADQAARLAERILGEIRRAVPHPAGAGATVTTSAGIAQLERLDLGLDPALSAADRALYAAKNAGRDRVMLANPLR